MRLDPRRSLHEHALEQGLIESAHRIEDPKGVHAGLGQRAVQGQTSKRRHGVVRLARHQQAMNRVPPPSVGRRQVADQLDRTRPPQSKRSSIAHALGHDPIDASAILTGLQVEDLDQLGGDPLRMLDVLAVHVDDIQRPVGPVGHEDGPTPRIARREKRDALASAAGRDHGLIGVRQHIPVHEVADRLGHEHVAVIAGRQKRSAIDLEPAGRRDVADVRNVDPARLLLAARKHARSVTVIRYVRLRRPHGQVRISRQISPRQHHLMNVSSVATDEPPAEIIEREAELGLAGDGFELFRARAKPKVRPAYRNAFARKLRRSDLPAAVPVGHIDPIVEPPLQAVDAVLLVAFDEALEHDAPHVRSLVAVGVFEVVDVRRARHIDPAVPRHHAGRKAQPVDKDRTRFVPPVAVDVLEQPHPALLRCSFSLRAVRIAAHLHHVQPGVGVERDGHRVGDLRLGRYQLDRQVIRQGEVGERFGRGKGLVRGHILGHRPGGHEPLGNRPLRHCQRPEPDQQSPGHPSAGVSGQSFQLAPTHRRAIHPMVLEASSNDSRRGHAIARPRQGPHRCAPRSWRKRDTAVPITIIERLAKADNSQPERAGSVHGA